MGKRKSKLKQMAEAGNPWAIETLARMQAQGRAAWRHQQQAKDLPLYDGDAPPWSEATQTAPDKAKFAEAMRDADDIRTWTDGPKRAPWRVYRLAQALAK